MGSIMYTSFGREKPKWPGSETWPLLFPNCVNLGKLFFLSELSLLCEMVIIIVKNNNSNNKTYRQGCCEDQMR